MKLRQAWLIAELLGALNLAKSYKKNTEEWLQIQTAKAWLKGIDITRDLVVYQIGILACVMTLVFSVILMEVSIVLLLSVSFQAKATILLVMGGIDFAVVLSIFGFFLSSERWLKKAARHNTYLAELLRKRNGFPGLEGNPFT